MWADIYILVETKLEGAFDGAVQSIWSNRWVAEFHKEAMIKGCGQDNFWRLAVSIIGKFTGLNERVKLVRNCSLCRL